MPTDHAISVAMIRFGGSFVSRLGQLWQAGDAINQARLRAAFADEFETYGEYAERSARQQDQARQAER